MANVPLAITPAEGAPRSETLDVREVWPESWGGETIASIISRAILRLDGPRVYVSTHAAGVGELATTATITVTTAAGEVVIGPLVLNRHAVRDALALLNREQDLLKVLIE